MKVKSIKLTTAKGQYIKPWLKRKIVEGGLGVKMILKIRFNTSNINKTMVLINGKMYVLNLPKFYLVCYKLLSFKFCMYHYKTRLCIPDILKKKKKKQSLFIFIFFIKKNVLIY